eukprot:scaffold25466_cov34-Tisochrysis_lutea.AAC.5
MSPALGPWFAEQVGGVGRHFVRESLRLRSCPSPNTVINIKEAAMGEGGKSIVMPHMHRYANGLTRASCPR